MIKRFLSASVIAATLLSVSAKNDDPVLMTINGKDVRLSEFEYLYNKNNSQQQQPQSLEEYMDMFIIYKLKVADAEAAGIDTTAAFIKEFSGYQNELAQPYLVDTSVEDSLINLSYERMQEDVKVSHIMIPRGDHAKQTAFLDSIRTVILNGGDFGAEAQKHSIDQYSAARNGSMGYIKFGAFPYTFENAAYTTPVGEISEVVQTDFGYHIVKVDGRRPAVGQVHAKHILKLTQGMTPEQEAVAKAQIDSIYNLLLNGADFSALATAESQCGSASQGGDLGWFGSGQMIPEFENAAFALADGAISEPIKTQFGYHIIYRVESKGVPALDEARKSILSLINGDERGGMSRQARIDQLKAAYNAHIDNGIMEQLRKDLVANGGYDSVFIKKYQNSTLPVIIVGKQKYPLCDVIKRMPLTAKISAENGFATLRTTAESVLESKIIEYEITQLPSKYPDFRNLINEYRDGMLLFEISNRNVWDRASKDTEGLEAFFNANRQNYKWDTPKYKGYVVFASSDSLLNIAKQYIADNNIANDSLSQALRAKFGREIRVERVIAAQGENAIIDYIAFGAGKPATDKNKWNSYFGIGNIIATPEEALDVRGQVTSDYQALLEKNWIAELKAKYPVKINQKVLKTIK